MASRTAGSWTPEADFLERSAPLIEQELFLRRYSNWRLSLAAMTCIAWMIAALYRYLEPGATTMYWAMAMTLGFGTIATMCAIYERHRPRDLASPAQRNWMLGWTIASSSTSALAGLLPWFIPGGVLDAQLSSAALVAILMMAFVVSRANRLLIHATVATYAFTMSVTLALHAQVLWAIPVGLLFTAMLLGMGLLLNDTLRQAIGDQMYARYLHGELQRSHAREMAVQQRESALNERARMMADLHDGFGAQLVSSLRQLERGHIGVDGAVVALRECIDDLRLTVDAHEPAARSLATLLGMLRYRMQPRLQAAGITLAWQVEDLPEGASLQPLQSLDLLRILQQAMANVLQHADARTISIVARRKLRQLEIAVEDDGKGMDPLEAMRKGRGIAGMQRRAARLGGELLLEAREGGGTALRLQLRWPVGGFP
jgi:signal transduction histidine kinase